MRHRRFKSRSHIVAQCANAVPQTVLPFSAVATAGNETKWNRYNKIKHNLNKLKLNLRQSNINK